VLKRSIGLVYFLVKSFPGLGLPGALLSMSSGKTSSAPQGRQWGLELF
jgi:hypothetical protein